MRKFFVFCLIVLAVASVAVPAMAGRGDPETAQQGEQTGRAQQAGPGGPNYGNPTIPPAEVIPTVQVSDGAKAYRVYLPFVSTCASVSVPGRVSVSASWY